MTWTQVTETEYPSHFAELGQYTNAHQTWNIEVGAAEVSPWYYWEQGGYTSYGRIVQIDGLHPLVQWFNTDILGPNYGLSGIIQALPHREYTPQVPTLSYRSYPANTAASAISPEDTGRSSASGYTWMRPVSQWVQLLAIVLDIPICNYCGIVHTETAFWGREPEHPSCTWCGERTNPDAPDTLRDENVVLCGYCTEDSDRCDACEILIHVEDAYRDEYDELAYCAGCYREDYCEECEARVGRGMALCHNCESENRIVKHWDYKPDFNFHPSIPSESKLYLGMEAETAFRNQPSTNLENWYNRFIRDHYEDLIYVKSDSTVEYGYEINTHPMQFEWAMDEFPWPAFQALVDEYEAYDTHRSCGGHIHLNKDAFSTPHMLKFLRVHLDNGPLLGILGGRGTRSQWGSFEEMHRPDGERMKIIAKKKYHDGMWQRYVAVNLNPEFSVELRYPQGASSPFLMKKNLQLAHAVYDFSHKITVPQIQKGILKDSGYLLDWIMRRQDTYPELATYAQQNIIQRQDVEAL